MDRTVTAEADRQGVMVALVPAEDASKALLEHSGGSESLDEQHITLAYLGTLGDEIEDTELVRDQVFNTVDSVALRYSPLNGEANGWGVFQNETDVLVSLWNIPGINGLRQALVEALRDFGIPVKQNYGFTPHQTMTYAEAGQVQVPGRMDAPVKSDFMHLVLSWGGEWHIFPLAGVRKESAYTGDMKNTPRSKMGSSASNRYTLLPKDAGSAFRVIQEMAGGTKTAAGPTRGGNPDNPGQFSSEDKGHRKKDKSKSKSDDSGDDSGGRPGGSGDESGGGGGGKGTAPKGGDQAAPEGGGDLGAQDGQDGEGDDNFGHRGLSEILTSGGFSMDDRSGAPPEDGYMLSLDKQTEEVFDLDSLTAEDLEDYYSRHEDLIAQDDKFVGAWVDDGKVYLDVSTNMRGDEAEVLAAAEGADQLAIWDVTAGETIYTSLGGEQDADGEAEEPPEGYTAVPYDPEATSFTEEQRIAHGDMYGHYLPEGRYAEGDPRNEPEFERIMAEKTELSIKYVKVSKEDIEAGATEGGQTEDLYDHVFDPETGKHNAYVPERQAIHQQILSDLSQVYANFPRNGKAVVMAGPPGAGKSTYLKAHGQENFGIEVKGDEDPKDDPPAKNFVTINPDDFKELLPVDMSRYPGLEDNEVAFMVHEESSYLAKIATAHFMSQGYDVIIDVTLGNASSAIRKYVAPFEDLGYDYQVALVDGTMNNSLNNAGLRYKRPDRETGVRSYGGRFLPMGVVESNNPTEGSGYRSKNAEQFVEFIQQEGVSKALVYDPETQAVAVAKDESGVSDWRSSGEDEGGEVTNLSDRRRSDEDDDGAQDKAASRLRRRVLSSILRVTERDDNMQRTARNLPQGHTEITTKIVEYSDGQIDLDTLTDWLVNHTYAPAETNPSEVGTAEWYNWVEDQPLQPGTYDEVAQAAAAGLLDWNDYATINKAVVNSANPAAQ